MPSKKSKTRPNKTRIALNDESKKYFLHEEHNIRFNSTIVLSKTPTNDQVNENEFVVVIHKRRKYWALFRCPCGCGHVITLSLKPDHRPYWAFRRSKNLPTLQPSILQLTPCRSHFFVWDGKIVWCQNFSARDEQHDKI